jgi:hypothetical protein
LITRDSVTDASMMKEKHRVAARSGRFLRGTGQQPSADQWPVIRGRGLPRSYEMKGKGLGGLSGKPGASLTSWCRIACQTRRSGWEAIPAPPRRSRDRHNQSLRVFGKQPGSQFVFSGRKISRFAPFKSAITSLIGRGEDE